jgi:hypothetical protein
VENIITSQMKFIRSGNILALNDMIINGERKWNSSKGQDRNVDPEAIFQGQAEATARMFGGAKRASIIKPRNKRV